MRDSMGDTVAFELRNRRGRYVEADDLVREGPADGDDVRTFEELDVLYRALVALLYNYVPTSGHPGGSISSGRFVARLLFDTLDLDVSRPGREDADIVSYAAGHKALGLYALWALRDEVLRTGEPYRSMILVAAHAGLKTGEDGPTHADPQALQVMLENFPPGTAITLTPWEPQEVRPLLAAALARRPAVIVPFVTRPGEIVPDRARSRLAPATAARSGVYRLRAARHARRGGRAPGERGDARLRARGPAAPRPRRRERERVLRGEPGAVRRAATLETVGTQLRGEVC